MALLGIAVHPKELRQAVNASLTTRPMPPLTVAQRATLEAFHGFDDHVLLTVAPLVHEMVRDHGKDL